MFESDIYMIGSFDEWIDGEDVVMEDVSVSTPKQVEKSGFIIFSEHGPIPGITRVSMSKTPMKKHGFLVVRVADKKKTKKHILECLKERRIKSTNTFRGSPDKLIRLINKANIKLY